MEYHTFNQIYIWNNMDEYSMRIGIPVSGLKFGHLSTTEKSEVLGKGTPWCGICTVDRAAPIGSMRIILDPIVLCSPTLLWYWRPSGFRFHVWCLSVKARAYHLASLLAYDLSLSIVLALQPFDTIVCHLHHHISKDRATWDRLLLRCRGHCHHFNRCGSASHIFWGSKYGPSGWPLIWDLRIFPN